VPADQTLYSFSVEIHTADYQRSGLDNLAQPGTVVEAFSVEALTPDLVGKEITADLELTGDTRRVQWWISNIHRLPY